MNKIKIHEDASRTVLATEQGIIEIECANPLYIQAAQYAPEALAAADVKILTKAGKSKEWIAAARKQRYMGRYAYLSPELLPALDIACAKAIELKAARDAEINAFQARPDAAERISIERLYNQAAARQDYPGEYFALIAEADAALTAWGIKFPAAKAAEDAQALRDKAAHLREIAAGALTYDADGMLDAAAQQARHDELIAQAEAVEAQI